MSKTRYFEPLKRIYRNWLRKKNRILPSEVPLPFFYARDIDAVRAYFSGAEKKQKGGLIPYSSGLRGNCYQCKEEVEFAVDLPARGEPFNWRELFTRI